MMRRTAARLLRHGLLVLGALVVVAAPLGCKDKYGSAQSPEEAYSQLLAAAEEGDAARLFDVLDTPTKWAIETVHKSQREMRKLVLESYPPEARDAALARLPAACEEDLERPRRYFRRLDDSAATLGEIKHRLEVGTGKPAGSVKMKEGTADVWREGGSVFHFVRDDSKAGETRWGYSELRDTWELRKERALHELDVVRDNARLYSQRLPSKDSAAAVAPPSQPLPPDGQKGSAK